MVSQSIYRLFQTYRYGIADANTRDEIPKTWEQRVIAPSFLGIDTARCPILVDTAPLSDEDKGMLLGRMETEIQGQLDCIFSLLLESEEDFQGLSRHLARRLVVQLEHNGRPMQFRYFDPGTFLQLPGLIGDEGMNWLLGPVNSVLVPWAGELQVYKKPMAASAGFRLAPKLPALLDISIINRAATQLPPAANQRDWIERCSRIRSHLLRARKYSGLVGRDDLAAFALHAENCHPRFDDHKIIRDLLEELAEAKAEDQLDYRELTARLESSDWEKISHDLSENVTREGMPS